MAHLGPFSLLDMDDDQLLASMQKMARRFNTVVDNNDSDIPFLPILPQFEPEEEELKERCLKKLKVVQEVDEISLYTISRLADRMFKMEEMLTFSITTDNAFTQFLAANQQVNTTVCCISQKITTALELSKADANQTKPEIDVYIDHIRHLKASKGQSLFSYCNMNKSVAMVLNDNIEQLEQVYQQFKNIR